MSTADILTPRHFSTEFLPEIRKRILSNILFLFPYLMNILWCIVVYKNFENIKFY